MNKTNFFGFSIFCSPSKMIIVAVFCDNDLDFHQKPGIRIIGKQEFELRQISLGEQHTTKMTKYH